MTGDSGPSSPLEENERLEEALASRALAPLASAHHKHVDTDAGEWLDEEPLPPEALGLELSFSKPSMPPSPAIGRNDALQTVAPKVNPARGELGLLQRLAALEQEEKATGRKSGGRASSNALKKNRPFEFPDDKPIRVRVLDVDSLSMEELHKAFAYTLVRRLPAEQCIRVASRIATFRENYNQTAYENLIRDCGHIFGPTHGPELVALFSRCHATVSVPYLVDYTRRFGTFSREFIASQVEQSLNPGFFDFIRYHKQGGVRPLPPIIAKPWALSSYTRLLAKSHIKSELHEQLKLVGSIPSKQLEAANEDLLPAEARLAERLSAATALKLDAPTTREDVSTPPSTKAWKTSRAEAHRPALLDAIMEAEYSGRGWRPEDAEAIRAAAKTTKHRARSNEIGRQILSTNSSEADAPGSLFSPDSPSSTSSPSTEVRRGRSSRPSLLRTELRDPFHDEDSDEEDLEELNLSVDAILNSNRQQAAPSSSPASLGHHSHRHHHPQSHQTLSEQSQKHGGRRSSRQGAKEEDYEEEEEDDEYLFSDEEDDEDEDQLPPGARRAAAAAQRQAEKETAGFGLQFEHVVPENSLGIGTGKNALVRLGAGSGPGAEGPGGAEEALELADMPDRFWNTLRRRFFRHNYRAYRVVDGQWKQVADPRGPRFKPKRRHRSRAEKKEQRLRWAMQNGGAESQATPPA